MKNPKDVTKWTVLVVDDEPDSIEIVAKVLRHYGATVHTAVNGQEGLDFVKQVKPTFILSDLSMPIMDGWEMLKTLQGDPRTKDIPVIALTAHAMAGDRERAMSAGFHYYLTKPFRPTTLLADLLKLLELPMPSPEDMPKPSEQSSVVSQKPEGLVL